MREETTCGVPQAQNHAFIVVDDDHFCRVGPNNGDRKKKKISCARKHFKIITQVTSAIATGVVGSMSMAFRLRAIGMAKRHHCHLHA